jgi:hypothetical protein
MLFWPYSLVKIPSYLIYSHAYYTVLVCLLNVPFYFYNIFVEVKAKKVAQLREQIEAKELAQRGELLPKNINLLLQ